MRNTRYALFVLLAICSAACTSSCGKTRSVSIVVKNESEVTLNNIKISFTGGSERLGSLAPGKTGSVGIRSKGESGVYLHFVANGTPIKKAVAGSYIEPGFGGSITVTIDRKFAFTVDNKVKIYPR